MPAWRTYMARSPPAQKSSARYRCCFVWKAQCSETTNGCCSPASAVRSFSAALTSRLLAAGDGGAASPDVCLRTAFSANTCRRRAASPSRRRRSRRGPPPASWKSEAPICRRSYLAHAAARSPWLATRSIAVLPAKMPFAAVANASAPPRRSSTPTTSAWPLRHAPRSGASRAIARVAVRARAQQRLARRRLAVARAVVEGAAARIVGRGRRPRQPPAAGRAPPTPLARERHGVVAGRVALSLICCAIAALALSLICRVIVGRRVALSLIGHIVARSRRATSSHSHDTSRHEPSAAGVPFSGFDP